jgi:hypothetical protein
MYIQKCLVKPVYAGLSGSSPVDHRKSPCILPSLCIPSSEQGNFIIDYDDGEGKNLFFYTLNMRLTGEGACPPNPVETSVRTLCLFYSPIKPVFIYFFINS